MARRTIAFVGFQFRTSTRFAQSFSQIADVALNTDWTLNAATLYIGAISLEDSGEFRFQLNPTATGFGGSGGHELTTAFETNGIIEYTVDSFTFRFDFSDIGDTSEPYNVSMSSLPAAMLTAATNFINNVAAISPAPMGGTIRMILPGAPLAPISLDEANIDHDSADLSWGAIDDNDADLTAVHLDWREGDSGDFTRVTLGATATSYALGSLSPGTQHQWRVRGVNAEGEGDWSQVASFTTLVPVVTVKTALSGRVSATGRTRGRLSVTNPTVEVPTLTLADDLNLTGLEFEMAAVFSRGGTTDTLWAEPPRGTVGSLTEGEVGLGAGETRISRIQVSAGNQIRVNDNDDPVALSPNDYFNGEGNDLTCHIITPTDTYSFPVAGNIAAAGGGFIRFLVGTAAHDALQSLPDGHPFILAFSRAEAAPVVTTALSGRSSATGRTRGRLSVNNPTIVTALRGSIRATGRTRGRLSVANPTPTVKTALSGRISATGRTRGRLSVSNPTIVTQLSGSIRAIGSTRGRLTVSNPSVAVPTLTLTEDLDLTGLTAEMAAVFTAGSSSDGTRWAEPPRGTIGTLDEGEVGLGTNETRISRIQVASQVDQIRLNDDDNPVALNIGDFFSGEGNDLTWHIITPTATFSGPVDGNIAAAGGGFIRLTVGSAAHDALEDLPDGHLFILAFTRTVDVTLPTATINTPNTTVDGGADLELDATVTGRTGSAMDSQLRHVRR